VDDLADRVAGRAVVARVAEVLGRDRVAGVREVVDRQAVDAERGHTAAVDRDRRPQDGADVPEPHAACRGAAAVPGDRHLGGEVYRLLVRGRVLFGFPYTTVFRSVDDLADRVAGRAVVARVAEVLGRDRVAGVREVVDRQAVDAERGHTAA